MANEHLRRDRGLIDIVEDNLGAVIIGVIMIIAILFGSYQKYTGWQKEQARIEQAQQERIERGDAEAKKRQKIALQQSWAVGPLPPTPPLGTMPKVPPIPPVTVLPNGQRVIRDRIQYLVEQNLVPEVKPLNQAIVSGEVVISIQSDVGLIASFGLVQRFLISSSEKKDDRPFLPTFTLNPAKMDAIVSQADVLRAMLVVYHESVHYRQWKNADDQRKLSFALKSSTEKNSPTQCEHIWQIEHEAYALECQVALSWGITDIPGELCLRSSDQVEFNKYLFVSMGNGYQGANMQECLPHWARLAGHPHWEAFR